MEMPVSEIRTTGVEVNYLLVCKRKLWFYTHGITMEHNSTRVEIGKEVHDTSLDSRRSELLIDETIRLDYIDKELAIHEIKMSRALDEASRYQILYYIYYLRNKGIDCNKGVIHFPESKRIENIAYDDECEKKITSIIEEINNIKNLPAPPEVDRDKKCSKCSYYELCFC
jgi:CRISPR-associated exonuclease Cas4